MPVDTLGRGGGVGCGLCVPGRWWRYIVKIIIKVDGLTVFESDVKELLLRRDYDGSVHFMKPGATYEFIAKNQDMVMSEVLIVPFPSDDEDDL